MALPLSTSSSNPRPDSAPDFDPDQGAGAERPESRPEGASPTAERAGFYLFAGHLFTLFGIALSNVLAGLMVLSAPWTAGRRRLAAAVGLEAPAGTAGKTGSPDWRAVAAPRRWLLAALAVYVAWLFLSLATSYDPAASTAGLSELYTLTTLILAFALVRGEERVLWVVDGLGLVGGGVAVWGLAQYLTGFGEINARIRGPFSHWMTFSGFLLLCDLLMVSALLFRGAALRRRGGGSMAGWLAVGWRAAAVALMTAALFGSLTRSAWVGLGVGLVVAALLRSPRSVVVFPVVALTFFLLAPVPLLHRVASTVDLTDPSNYDRLCMAEAAVHMVADRPLTGLGPEQVEPRYPIYRPPTAPRYSVPHLHNTYLQVAAERGLPALVAYLVLMLAPLVAAWRLYRRQGGRWGPRADLLVGASTALLAFHVAGLFEYNWGDTEVQRLVLFLVAVPFCLALGEARSTTGETVAEDRG